MECKEVLDTLEALCCIAKSGCVGEEGVGAETLYSKVSERILREPKRSKCYSDLMVCCLYYVAELCCNGEEETEAETL